MIVYNSYCNKKSYNRKRKQLWKTFYLSSDLFVKDLLTTKWLRKQKAFWKEKQTVTYLDYKDHSNEWTKIWKQPTLPAVQAARDAVLAADAIWIFSPVYNFAIPGVVKNLIDWLSRALDLSELVSICPSR